MVHVILTHEVQNFDKWKTLFDDGEGMRSGAGIKTSGVYRSVENPNQVVIMTEFPSADAVSGFLANPELKAAMEKGGVIGKPDIKILTKA
jgi:quinol monooxygenase YgiN